MKQMHIRDNNHINVENNYKNRKIMKEITDPTNQQLRKLVN